MAISPNSSNLKKRIRREMESRTAPQSTITGKEIPEQLITEEILPILPVKSLLKFRCVSKSWCSLIDSKRFIKAHLNNSIKSSWKSQRCIFFYHVEKNFKQWGLPSLFDKTFDKTFTAPISHSSDLGIDKSVILPVGCWNGLVCILLNCKRFILWNPTTKRFKNLPDLYIQDRYNYEDFVVTYGFGFDELSDDYKVFAIVNRDNARAIGMVYSLRSNSWKHIDKTELGFMGSGIYVSGKLHWCDRRKYDIVSFDLNRHVFGVVELPSYTNGYLHSVGEVGGCLSALFFHLNGDLDVWLMKEYGVKESWVKMVTVSGYNHLDKLVSTHDRFQILVAPNGEILLIRHSTIMIYDPIRDVLRPSQIAASDDGFASSAYYLGIYAESLVSLAPDAQYNQVQAIN